MSTYDLDASVAVKWVLAESDSDKALALRDDFKRQVHELIAPDTFCVEVAHALTRAERKGTLFQAEAIAKLADVLATAPTLHSYLLLLPRAVEFSSQTRVGVYDCLFLALAEREKCALVTADSKLIQRMSGFPIVSLAAL